MALTEQQKRIIFHMKKHHMTVDEMTGILLHLEKDTQQKEMIKFLLANPRVSPRGCVDKAVEIGKME